MGENGNASVNRSDKRRKLFIALALIVSTLISVGLLFYVVVLRSELSKANEARIQCLDEQVKLTEDLKKANQMVEMERFRSNHLEEELGQQRVIAQEAIKRMK
jgi:uncharacterized membrane protein YeiB